MSKKSFVTGAGILAISVIIAKVLGAVYRIPLASIIGAEGMGLYQFVYPVFALLLTLSSGAVPNAISITVSEHVSCGDEEGATRAFSVALKISIIIGLCGMVLMLLLAYPISLLQSKDALLGHLSIAPAILIVTIISAFRGWFMGHSNLVPSSISQITEGTVKLLVGITLTSYLVKYGIKYAVVGALLGVVASEFVTLIVMFIAYLVKRNRFISVKIKEEKETVSKLKTLALPLIVCGMILPISQFIDSVVIVNLLKVSSNQYAVSNYGIWSGIVTPLINLPVMVCITLGIAVTPKMVEGRQKHDYEFIVDKAKTASKLTFLLGIPFVFFYVFMAKGIIGVLYPRLDETQLNLATTLLQINAISVIGLSVFQIYSAMLQGLNRAKVPVKIMTACMVIKLLMSVILTPTLGIIGSAISASIGYLASGVVIAIYFIKFVNLSSEFVKNASLITLCGGIMSMIIILSVKFVNNVYGIIAVVAVSLIVYMLAVMAFRVFDEKELESMPFSKILLRFNKTMRGG